MTAAMAFSSSSNPNSMRTRQLAFFHRSSSNLNKQAINTNELIKPKM